MMPRTLCPLRSKAGIELLSFQVVRLSRAGCLPFAVLFSHGSGLSLSALSRAIAGHYSLSSLSLSLSLSPSLPFSLSLLSSPSLSLLSHAHAAAGGRNAEVRVSHSQIGGIDRYANPPLPTLESS